MNSRQIERAAYIAAHRLMTADLSAPRLACPGARRSAVLDSMAEIIKDVYEATATASPKKPQSVQRIPNLVAMSPAAKRASAGV
jgi:hypothetical protein